MISGSLLPLPLRYALRELRAGMRGFGIFLACLALGVMAIAGIGAISHALSDGLRSQGRVINGGDIEFSLVGREASPQERAFLAAQGRLSVVASTRAMARTADGRTALVEIKAVDDAYPLLGQAVLGGGGPLAASIGGEGTAARAAADATLFARLDLQPGVVVTIGALAVTLADRLTGEPDRLSGGIGLGPRLMLALPSLRASGLIQPGSLIAWRYRLLLPAEVSPHDVEQRADAAFPQAGWEVRTRDDASPELRRGIDRFTMFITLVGLTALLVGGVGVANAVRAFIERQRDTIATLKTLGAGSSLVIGIYLTQTLLLAALGIAIGLAAGAALPFVLAYGFAAYLPLPITPVLDPAGLLLAAAYGFLTALAFSLLPLGRVRRIGVSALFRDAVAPSRRWPEPLFLGLMLIPALALVGLAVAFAADRRVALVYVGAALGAFVLLRAVAQLLMAAARRLPRPRSTALRLALANIHRPGAATPSVVLSLGLGLCLLVALTLVDGNIRNQLAASIPARAPSFFFVDIRSADEARFEAFLRQAAPEATSQSVPMLRGRIVAVKGVPAEKLTPPSDIAWVLSGDRGVTFSPTVPEGSSVVDGAWWPADYRGPPLVSLERRIAQGLGLAVGDPITVNVLGRNITAKVGALRTLEWRNFGINFVLVYSPATFLGAPVSDIATLTWPHGASDAAELDLLRKVADAFPGVTTVRVKDTLETLAALAGQLAAAIRAAASIALLASVLVLAGALAAGQNSRLYDAVILKVLGAVRSRILLAYVLEYGLLGLAAAVFGVIAGTACAWLVVTSLMDFTFTFLPGPALLAAFGAMALTILFGLAGTWRILRQKPAAHLKSL
ncbi:ABC transporter permease [Labrys monachus]|uniref:ABC transport system permease protein n=1 Tax=Labrys monachus TaxID=217067 RepID=A0ABU0FNY3_9HYPH|nr:FtsX-like permease family protein [Labrys monachus]MDQ0396320.1 putative ABC transport system permease protein [Labrys monachus]